MNDGGFVIGPATILLIIAMPCMFLKDLIFCFFTFLSLRTRKDDISICFVLFCFLVFVS